MFFVPINIKIFGIRPYKILSMFFVLAKSKYAIFWPRSRFGKSKPNPSLRVCWWERDNFFSTFLTSVIIIIDVENTTNNWCRKFFTSPWPYGDINDHQQQSKPPPTIAQPNSITTTTTNHHRTTLTITTKPNSLISYPLSREEVGAHGSESHQGKGCA